MRDPGPSLRFKLALSYAAFVIVVGIVLFAVGLLVLRFVPDNYGYDIAGNPVPSRGALLEVFVRYAGWALAGLAVLGVGGGWLVAGWMLRPLDRIGDVVGRTRGGSLAGRIRLAGRRDELTDLADGFDDMLDRVEGAVEAERRFAANASHELRTPLAVTRTMLEVARAEPGELDVDRLLARLAETNDRSIAVTEALLALARADRGGMDLQRVDLAAVAAVEAGAAQSDAARTGIALTADLQPSFVSGHPDLLAQLTGNLLRNAVAYNRPEGFVHLQVVTTGHGVVLAVSNSGPIVGRALATTLTEPFVRGAGRARSSGDGAGLGLALVAAIVRAHDGDLELAPRVEGGLDVRVMMPSAS